MASNNKTNNSRIAMALAGTTDSVDIPKPHASTFWAGKDSFAAVAARSLPIYSKQAELPTPPNSISPSLPPHAFKNHAAAPPTPPVQALVDSDIDLQDAVDHANAQNQPQRGLALATGTGRIASLDAAGAITPTLLAKHHLPDILLAHGPLAIRHIMGYLTTSVPGFSGIPPAKARRLVVGALEGRGSGSDAHGHCIDVEFEKVGWGKWDAKRGNLPAAMRRGSRRQSPNTTRRHTSNLRSPSPYIPTELSIPHNRRPSSRARIPSSHSLSHRSLHSHNLKTKARMIDSEVDKMSLDDGDAGRSLASSDPLEDFPVLDDDDVTDEEDWASIGAAALRAGSSLSRSGHGTIFPQSYLNGRRLSYSSNVQKYEKGGVSVSLASTKPATKPASSHVPPATQKLAKSTDYGAGGVLMERIGSDSQEREAIEALIRLSSV